MICYKALEIERPGFGDSRINRRVRVHDPTVIDTRSEAQRAAWERDAAQLTASEGLAALFAQSQERFDAFLAPPLPL